MKLLTEWTPLFTAGIFFIGVLGVLMTIFGMMLRPINNNLTNHITKTEKKIASIERELKEMRKENNEMFLKIFERLPPKK